MDKDTSKSTFIEVLNQFPYEKFRSLIKDTGTDKYIKKLFPIKLLYIMFIAHIAQIKSIRALAKKIKNNIDFQDTLKLDSISASKLSRWQKLQCRHLISTSNADRVHIIDASTSPFVLTDTYGPITAKQKPV